jgi:hypothetical protein
MRLLNGRASNLPLLALVALAVCWPQSLPAESCDCRKFADPEERADCIKRCPVKGIVGVDGGTMYRPDQAIRDFPELGKNSEKAIQDIGKSLERMFKF